MPEIDDVVAYGFPTLSILSEKPGRLKAELPRVKEKTRGQGSPYKDKLQDGEEERHSPEENHVDTFRKFDISTRAAKVSALSSTITETTKLLGTNWNGRISCMP